MPFPKIANTLITDMLKHESIYEYYVHQHRKVELYLEQCIDHAEPELVHQLRLTIKKLRAINKLARQSGFDDSEEYERLATRVKKLFKMAGEIRDMQVQIQLLDTYEEFTGNEYTEFRRYLHKREKKRISQLCDAPHKVKAQPAAIAANEKTGSRLSGMDDQAITNSAMAVLDGIYQQTTKLSKGRISNVSLHSIRKKVKQVRYIHNVLEVVYPGFNYERIPDSTIREIESTAGHWHDCLVRVEVLRDCITKMKKPDSATKVKYRKLMGVFRDELKVAYKNACLAVRF